jgi:hypothetical protein
MPIHARATLCAVVSAFVISTEVVRAGDLGSRQTLSNNVQPGWTVHATPYAWLPFLDGTSTIRGRTADIDLRPVQVLENLDAAPWMSYVELRKGSLVLFNDIFYAKLGTSSSGVRARDFGPVLSGSFGASASLDFEQLVVEFGGAYEITRWRQGIGPGLSETFTAIDVLAGARYWRQRLAVGIDITGAANIGGFEVSGDRATNRGGSVDWVDPFVGLRVRHGIAPGQEVIMRADIGGFNVGSDLSWNLMGAYSFDLGVHDGAKYTGLLGYRALDVDYSEGSGPSHYSYNVLQHGPIMGLTISF